MSTTVRNVTLNEPQFTIEKQCDRCMNNLFFSEAVVTDVEVDANGDTVHSSLVCPICGNLIVLYSCKPEMDGVGSES